MFIGIEPRFTVLYVKSTFSTSQLIGDPYHPPTFQGLEIISVGPLNVFLFMSISDTLFGALYPPNNIPIGCPIVRSNMLFSNLISLKAPPEESTVNPIPPFGSNVNPSTVTMLAVIVCVPVTVTEAEPAPSSDKLLSIVKSSIYVPAATFTVLLDTVSIPS